NKFIRMEFESHSGYIKRMYDKKNDTEVLSAFGAIPIVIDENECDTWAHGFSEFRNEIGRFTDAELILLEQGPLRARLRITNKYNSSTLQQDFIMYNDRSEIEVRVKLDWRETHKMLKLSFPVNVESPKATYEIPYGFIERAVNGEEEPGQQWLDVSGLLADRTEEYYGIAILNDAKYSYDVKDNDLRMTIVRSPIYADHFGERDEYCEFMDQGIQEFKYVILPHMCDWKQSGAVKKAYELNVPPVQIIETYHKGPMPLKLEAISIYSDNIIASVFKRAEDGDGYILRCYETNGVETSTKIELPILKRKWETIFGKCEIKTFWIPEDKDKNIEEKNLIEY
ncbi:MAG TPA: glycoside hydrolase family 38 C-terminal domain-containing protein, partial [Ruminiclostridium sp.]